MVGHTVGKYRILSRLGRGGMGTVYRAIDETLDREVAIKCLNPDLSDPEVLKRFRAEALTLARLNHSNIAMLFELAEHDGQLLMVMEFVRGETFESISQRGPLGLDRSRELCSQVLDALGHAHRAGIVHRDLKPANLMLTEAGLVKVMDFGLARMAGTEHLTTDGFMVGTPAYMAPEQVLAEEIDGRADLYAMGVVLYRLLTAKLPFKADSGISMAHKQVHDLPTPVRAVRIELPPACEDIIGRALAKSPSDRFQTAEEFKAALAALSVANSSGSIAVPGSGSAIASSGSTLAVTSAQSARSVVLPEEPTVVLKSAPRKQFSMAVLIAAVVLAGIPTVYLFLRPPAGVPSASAAAAVSSTRPPGRASTSVPRSGSGSVAEPGSVPETVSDSRSTLARSTSTTLPTGPGRTVAPSDAAKKNLSRPTAPDASSPNGALSDPGEASPPRPPLPSVSFSQIKLLKLDDPRPHDREVLVTFGADALDVVDGSSIVRHTPYGDVIGLFHSHSREPRWTKPDGTSVLLTKIGGRFAFLKGPSDWITVQTRAAFIPLHVPDGELPRLVSELETRTGTHVILAR